MASTVSTSQANGATQGYSRFAVWLSIAYAVCAVMLSTAAWIWPSASSDLVSIPPPHYTEFKALAYAIILIQSVRGLLQAQRTKSRAAIVFLLQTAVFAAALFVSHDPFYDGQAFINFLGITFGLIALRNTLGSWRAYDTLVNVVIGLLISSVLVAVLLPKFGLHTSGDFKGYWRGTFAHKNNFGAIAFLAAGMAWPYLLVKKPLKFLFVVGLALLCLVGTKSGTSIACAAMALAIGAVIFIADRMRIPRWLTVVVLVLVAVAAYALRDWLTENVLALLHKNATFTGRTKVWTYMRQLASDSPIVGHGPSFLITDTGDMAHMKTMVNFDVKSAHNAYLETFVEFGYLGVIIFVASYVILFWNWVKSPSAFGVFNILVATIVLPLMAYDNFEAQNHLYAGIGTLAVNFLLLTILDRQPVAAQGQTMPTKVRARPRPQPRKPVPRPASVGDAARADSLHGAAARNWVWSSEPESA